MVSEQFVKSMVERVGGAYQVIEKISKLDGIAIAVVGDKAQENESRAKRTEIEGYHVHIRWKSYQIGCHVILGQYKISIKNE